jgi:GNAT superfamily N-acetyltransferase
MVPIKEVWSMRIQHTHRSELAGRTSELRRPWLEAALDRLLGLPDYPRSRVLVAAEGERVHAVLGLELTWTTGGRLECATIRVLEIDPDHFDRGLGSRLVRVVEDIAHINGCDRLCAAPNLEHWNAGRCRVTFNRYDLGRRACRDDAAPSRRSCA